MYFDSFSRSLFCGVFLRLWPFFYFRFLSFFWRRSPHILQQPYSVFKGAFVGFNKFPSLVCWCTVIHYHRPQGPTLFRRVIWDFACVLTMPDLSLSFYCQIAKFYNQRIILDLCIIGKIHFYRNIYIHFVLSFFLIGWIFPQYLMFKNGKKFVNKTRKIY